jgi:hypothetical protein
MAVILDELHARSTHRRDNWLHEQTVLVDLRIRSKVSGRPRVHQLGRLKFPNRTLAVAEN